MEVIEENIVEEAFGTDFKRRPGMVSPNQI